MQIRPLFIMRLKIIFKLCLFWLEWQIRYGIDDKRRTDETRL
ncbi:hypothetical protein HD_1381 [[Haemophilus] ducreyi 35000HP]|uniref:Uncharacterized protein n=1 Tax=Haemophilus ducreyi (strain 35000HP / ATCC 700724) TaxID=233412 RepID=Q7VLP1_HAEDU|nr:hypothetical protein HD_1381 [[Haemophilus] ducreyi 35000HP]